MMKKACVALLLLTLALASCNLPGVQIQTVSAGPTLDQNAANTAIAQTVQAALPAQNQGGDTGQAPAVTEAPAQAVNPTETLNPTITLTPTLTQTVTPSVPMIHSTVNTNCRFGPSNQYNIIGFLLTTDTPVQVRGRLGDGGWWYISNPRYPTASCWVWDDTTIVEGNTTSLPIISPPTLIVASGTNLTYTGACPTNITIIVTITTFEAQNVTYTISSSGGGAYGPFTRSFGGPSTQAFNQVIPMTVDLSGWYQVNVTAPFQYTTAQVPFTIDCQP
ncbi:MAG TPA: hypothetical protein VN376_02195 [Longilinea sp.]|nr:hypothetical protein [Longilinea sp.]